jgi:hypothetical protein
LPDLAGPQTGSHVLRTDDSVRFCDRWPLSGYFGDASDLPQAVLQDFLDAVAAGKAAVPIARTYATEEIARAHADMEHARVSGSWWSRLGAEA